MVRRMYARTVRARAWRIVAGMVLTMALIAVAVAQSSDSDESAYAPSTLAKIMGGSARAQNDEAELAAPGQWFHTTATYTGHKRPLSGRFRPIVSSWVSSRGLPPDQVEM